MASGKTIDGIKVNVTVDDLDDYDIAETLAIIAEADEPGEKSPEFQVEFMKAAYTLPKMIFKNDWKRIKGELRAKNDGNLPNSVVFEFVNKVMTAVGSKN